MTSVDIQDSKPSFCLVGTSNGVHADGYDSAFADSKYLSRFTNYSLDFSSSALFSLRAPLIPLKEFDVCILDFAVNDGIQLQSGVTSADLVRSTAVDAVRHILSMGCLPAILILPVLSLFESVSGEGRQIYLDIAAEYKLPVFDGYAYLHYLKNQGVSVKTLFKDDTHVKRETAARIGSYVLEGLLFALRHIHLGPEVTNSAETYRYFDSNQIAIDNNEAVSRGTHLFASDILCVTDRCEARIDAAAAGGEVTAIAVDWANSSGALTLSARTSFNLNLNNPYGGDDPKRFTFGVYPVKNPVALNDRSVELTIESTPLTVGRLALGGFVIRKVAQTTFRTRLDAPLVISDSLVKFGLPATLRDVHRWKRAIFLFNNLTDFLQRKSTPSGIYTIQILGVFFDFLVENGNAATTIVVFHPEIPDRASVKLPFFVGQRLAGATANVILVSDPSLYAHPTLSLAWFAGRQGCPVQPIIKIILQSLNAGLNDSRLIFTGESGGGFAALYYSFFFPNSLSVPSNPQTIIGAFTEAAVRMYCKACFRAEDKAQIQCVLDETITSDLTRLYGEGFPNHIVYCQNANDDHVELHETPFRNALPARDRGQFAVVRGNWGAGHVTPPASEWSRLLSDAVNWEGDWSSFVSSADFAYLGSVERQAPPAAPRTCAASFKNTAPETPLEAILFYGQSHCGAPTMSKTPMSKTLMSNTPSREARYADHVISFPFAQSYGSIERPVGHSTDFVPFHNAPTYLMVQTPMAYYSEHLLSEAGAPPRMRFVHTTWDSGKPIGAFLPGTPAYATITHVVEDAKTVAGHYGRDTHVSTMVWIHGEGISDGYGGDLRRLISGLSADLRQITGQLSPPVWLIAQTNNSSGIGDVNQVPLDQYDASVALEGVILIGPMYQLPFISRPDSIPADERGQMMFGELIALVYHTAVQEKRPFVPLHPTAVTGTGRRVTVGFALPGLPLAWDTAWVPPVAHYGFAIRRGEETVAITEVRISGRDAVEITLAEPLGSGDYTLSYAMGQDEAPNGWARGRGQLMSPTPHASLSNLEGFPIPDTVRHYCVRFVSAITLVPEKEIPWRPPVGAMRAPERQDVADAPGLGRRIRRALFSFFPWLHRD